MSEKLNDQITKMISDNSDDFEAAVAIAENVNRAKETILLKLFKTLERKLENSTDFPYELVHNKYDYREAIRKFYGNRKQYPDLFFRYKKIDDKREIWLGIEVEHRLFCGLAVVDGKGENSGKLIMTQEELKQHINTAYAFYDDSWWFYWEYLLNNKKDSTPNFVETNDILIKLFDEKYFNEFTDKCVARIIELAEHMKK